MWFLWIVLGSASESVTGSPSRVPCSSTGLPSPTCSYRWTNPAYSPGFNGVLNVVSIFANAAPDGELTGFYGSRNASRCMLSILILLICMSASSAMFKSTLAMARVSNTWVVLSWLPVKSAFPVITGLSPSA